MRVSTFPPRDICYIRDAEEIIFYFFFARVQLRKGTLAETSFQRKPKTKWHHLSPKEQRRKKKRGGGRVGRQELKKRGGGISGIKWDGYLDTAEQRRQVKEQKQSNTCWQLLWCFDVGSRDKIALEVLHDSEMTQVVTVKIGIWAR